MQSFLIVYIIYLLFLRNINLVLKKLKRVTKKGGRIADRSWDDGMFIVHSISPSLSEFRTLQALRELGSVVYQTVAKFGTPSVLDTYTLTNLLKYDPLFELISGYFPNAAEEEVKQITNKLWNCFIPYLFLLKKYKQEIWNDWSKERRRSYKMDHDLFYILAMTSLYPLFRNSDIFRLYPSSLSWEDLMKKAEVYLGERYEYLLYLLEGKSAL